MEALEVVRPGDFNREQIQLMKDTVCKGATDVELKLFAEVCKAKRLDPFAKQIHAVKRWDSVLQRESMTFQTGIDGYRLIAERTGKYKGQQQPQWCGDDGVWREVWLKKEPPVAARAAVYREGFIEPLVRIARYPAYVQTKKDGAPNSMWAKMGPEQLHKCAEALALRAAFPEELAGLYTNEEMGQAENGAAQAQQEVAERKITEMKKARTPKAVESALGVSENDIIEAQTEEPPTELERTLEKSIEQAQAYKDPGPDKYVALGRFADLKTNIIAETGNDQLYYQGLAEAGFRKSNEIPTSDMRRAYRIVVAAFTNWKKQQAPIEDGE